MEAECNTLIAEGIPEQAVRTIMRSVRKGTRQVYEAKWGRFGIWCEERGEDPYNASLGCVLGYLQAHL